MSKSAELLTQEAGMESHIYRLCVDEPQEGALTEIGVSHNEKIIKYWHVLLAILVSSIAVCIILFGVYLYETPKRRQLALQLEKEIQIEQTHGELFQGPLSYI
ncbi:unnamed protein product [Meganyctiphanes norvegica]|uniref:Uncharacterized protein n=1 Tax=Meganyctiphanes norvegica TaxID=48144 RepID=A0AAV2QT48_MEGNR